VLKFLLEKGADINKRNTEGKTPLFVAVSKNYSGAFVCCLSVVASEPPSSFFIFRPGETSVQIRGRPPDGIRDFSNGELSIF
jgi:ankyrin repeat protein